MFNSTEKYAALGKDFKMHVYYKDQNLIEQPIEDEKKKREEK